jgi:sec-independent protein translocase protein TatA
MQYYFGQILGLGTPELIVILVILLLLFGASKLPKLAKSLGESMQELRKGMDNDKNSNKPKTTDQSKDNK